MSACLSATGFLRSEMPSRHFPLIELQLHALAPAKSNKRWFIWLASYAVMHHRKYSF